MNRRSTLAVLLVLAIIALGVVLGLLLQTVDPAPMDAVPVEVSSEGEAVAEALVGESRASVPSLVGNTGAEYRGRWRRARQPAIGAYRVDAWALGDPKAARGTCKPAVGWIWLFQRGLRAEFHEGKRVRLSKGGRWIERRLPFDEGTELDVYWSFGGEVVEVGVVKLGGEPLALESKAIQGLPKTVVEFERGGQPVRSHLRLRRVFWKDGAQHELHRGHPSGVHVELPYTPKGRYWIIVPVPSSDGSARRFKDKRFGPYELSYVDRRIVIDIDG